MRLLFAAPALVFALVAAGPTSARYSEAGAAQISPLPAAKPTPAWGGAPGQAPWMGYPYRR